MPFAVKVCRRLQTAFITILLVFISFGVAFLVKEYEFQEYEDFKSKKGNVSNSENIKIKAISLLLSFTIQLLNVIISASVRFFSAYEKHETWTQYNISVFHKLVLSTTLNTVLVIFLVNSYNIQINHFNPEDVQTTNWFRQDYGIPTDLYSLLLVDAFVTPVILIFSPVYLIKLWKRHQVRTGKRIVNQQEANDL